MPNPKMKLVFFELNEVPWRVIDDFVRENPGSNLAAVLPRARQFETKAVDEGHLSPWKTWPTVHRGVNDAQHRIEDFGQSLDEQDGNFPPLWQILSAAGISCGVCASLHTYPLPAHTDRYSFFLPDAFAPGTEAHPEVLRQFQQLNLTMSRQSARNVSRSIPLGSAISFLSSVPALGIKPGTFARIAAHLGGELKNANLKVRRRSFQFVLQFDVFMKQLRMSKPAFATCFTNHVASSMHRYWAASYPNDYEQQPYDQAWISRWGGEINFTMQLFDRALGELRQFIDKNPDYRLCVLSSMGQAATPFEPLDSQLYLIDPARFMMRLGLQPADWAQQPAMVPNYSFLITNEDAMSRFRDRLSSFRIAGEALGYREKENGFFSIDFGHRNIQDQPQHADINGQTVTFEELGLRCVEIEDRTNASAYHVPEGSMFIYPAENIPLEGAREEVRTTQIAPSVLSAFGQPIPAYMEAPADLFARAPET